MHLDQRINHFLDRFAGHKDPRARRLLHDMLVALLGLAQAEARLEKRAGRPERERLH